MLSFFDFILGVKTCSPVRLFKLSEFLLCGRSLAPSKADQTSELIKMGDETASNWVEKIGSSLHLLGKILRCFFEP